MIGTISQQYFTPQLSSSLMLWGARLEGQITSASTPVELAYNIQSDLNSIQASQSNLPYNL